MKKQIVTLLLFITLVNSTKAQQKSEIQQIETTIGWYFEGWGIGDTTLLGKAMHNTCHLKSFRDGKFNDIPRLEYLSRFKPRNRPDSLSYRIISLDVTGNIAAAKTEIVLGLQVFTDYFNLIKTDERWFIVDKIAIRQNK